MFWNSPFDQDFFAEGCVLPERTRASPPDVPVHPPRKLRVRLLLLPHPSSVAVITHAHPPRGHPLRGQHLSDPLSFPVLFIVLVVRFHQPQAQTCLLLHQRHEWRGHTHTHTHTHTLPLSSADIACSVAENAGPPFPSGAPSHLHLYRRVMLRTMPGHSSSMSFAL